MDKDRDISRSITISTPKKVGFVGGALLAGSALFVAACGGGSSKSGTTPEGGVAGAAVQPGGGSSPIVVKTEGMPSATAKVEVPTVAPTATAETAPLTVEELKAQVDTVFAGRTFPQLNRPQYATADGIKKFLDDCTASGATDAASASKVWSACQRLGDATRSIFALTKDENFWTLNQEVKVLAHKRLFELATPLNNSNPQHSWDLVEGQFFTKPQ
jgi:hypothetical protein